MKHRDFIRAAEALLLSPEYKELKSLREDNSVNFWHILEITRNEKQISRFLAWLLDPQESHSIGDLFLKNILIQAARADVNRTANINPLDIDLEDFSNAIIETELGLGSRRRCDIAVIDPRNGYFVIIENKIDANEGKDQTQDYFRISSADFPVEQYPNRVFIYLSPSGDAPQSENFVPIDYQAILLSIDSVIKHGKLPDLELFLIEQFRHNLLREIAMDPKTEKMVLKIYEEHSDVLEFILKTAKSKRVGETPQREWDEMSWFFNIGDNVGYSWDDSKKYSFICAGGSRQFRNIMERLKVDDIIYAYVSEYGYVGKAKIIHPATPFRDAILDSGQRLMNVEGLLGRYNSSEDDDYCDWIAWVEWEVRADKPHAIKERPLTSGTACKVYQDKKLLMEKIASELNLIENQR